MKNFPKIILYLLRWAIQNEGKSNMKKRIGLIGDNSIKYISTLLNILLEGNVAALIDWRIPLDIALSILHQVGINECYIDSAKYRDTKKAKQFNITLFDANQKGPEELPSSFYKRHKTIFTNQSKDDALIFFSSGTTGKAKGIRLSFAAISHNVDAIIDYMRPSTNDTILISKTLTHSSTVVGELFVGLKANAKIIVEPTVASPTFVLKNIKKYNVSIWCMNPTLLNIYSKLLGCGIHDISSLKYVFISGSIADKGLLEEAKRNFKNVIILNVYGLTEAGPRVTAQRISSADKLGSVGSPIVGVDVKIISEDGQELPQNSMGIIHVNTLSIMNGYFNGVGKESLYQGWLNTGDLGYIDDDGDLFVVGRTDNMILQGSHNVFPEEVENTLKQHELINDCVVFGIRHDIYGERIICLYLSSCKIAENELRTHCLSLLAPYEVPSEFLKVEKLPYNSNGKLMRHSVKELYEQGDVKL